MCDLNTLRLLRPMLVLPGRSTMQNSHLRNSRLFLLELLSFPGKACPVFFYAFFECCCLIQKATKKGLVRRSTRVKLLDTLVE